MDRCIKEIQNSNEYEYYEKKEIRCKIKMRNSDTGIEKEETKIFKYVMTIKPIEDENGNIERRPELPEKDNYGFINSKYYFCEFEIEEIKKWIESNNGAKCGVYIWYAKDNKEGNKVIYVGRTVDLYERFKGYRKITKAKCKKGSGQYTNCKMNHRAYEIYKGNNKNEIEIYFCVYEDLEERTREFFKPEENNKRY